MRRMIGAVALAVVVQATSVMAQDASPPPDAGPPPSGRGHGGGGRGDWSAPQTLAEFQARYRDRLMRADTDHDGRISLAEWMAAREGGNRRRFDGDYQSEFQRLDTNHDGFIEVAEIDAASAERFAAMDANHDGVLTPDERRAMWRGAGRNGEGSPPQ
jgi:hypothetical protein